MTIATKSTATNKELAAHLRTVVNELLEQHDATADFVSPLDEAARRLEFGYTPPEQPPEKSPIELAREKELHAAKMAQIERAKNAGLGGMGIAVFVQTTGHLHLFTSLKAMRDFTGEQKGTNLAYNRVVFHDAVGHEIVLVDVDHTG